MGETAVLETTFRTTSGVARLTDLMPVASEMGGTPVFVGTRVPLAPPLDYLEAGQPLSEFREDFPTVS